MLALFLFVIFGLGVAFFATQNTGTVHILLGNYLVSGIPLYVIVIGSLLLGILMSWIISLVNNLSFLFTLHGKDAEMKKAQRTIRELQEENTKLSNENEQLEHVKEKEIHEDVQKIHDEKHDDLRPSLLSNFKHSFG